MIKGLFINNPKAKDSIHESGFMTYECLKLSNKYELDYIEVDVNNREIKAGYDFYFFNYHDITMNWLDTAKLKKYLGCVITMILEVSPGNAFVRTPENHFNYYCVLDPTIVSKGNLYAFPRPLEKVDFDLPSIENKIPVIGSFGFATKGKGFEHVVEAVNKEFDKAIIRINIPFGDFVPDSKEYSEHLSNLCKTIAKPGIDVEITHDFFSKEELIKWCASNDLNCFLYDRNMPGLAATTDQAIISGKPLSISDNETFRHITAYLPPYPIFTLKESIEKSTVLINKIKEEWSQDNFMKRFEILLYENDINEIEYNGTQTYTLPVFEVKIRNTIKARIKKYKRKIKKFLFS
jgi:hypothetical protein